MALIESVQKHQITLSAGTSSNTATLTGVPTPDTDYCVPFVTSRVTDDNGGLHGAYAVRSRFDTSTTVEVSTGYAVSRALVVEVTVVEFNSTEVTIQNGTFAIANSATIDTLTEGTEYNQLTSKQATFIYHTWQNDSTFGSRYSANHVRGNITATDNVNFSRQDGTGNIAGEWWLVEADASAFAVEHLDWTMTGASTTDTIVTLAPVDTAKTMLLGSHKSTQNNDDNAIATVDIRLSSSSVVAIDRSASDGTVYGVTQVIEFASGGDETVYRGTVSSTDGDDTVSIGGTVSASDSMAHVAGSTGSFTTGSFPGSDATDCPDAHCALTLPSGTQVQIEHGTSGGEAGDVSWEVVELMAGGAGTPRRVMVIS